MLYDGLYQVPTLAEIVRLVRAKEAETGRRIGLYPELKHPSFLLTEAGIDMVDLLLRELRELGIDESGPVFLQSLEVGVLQRLKRRSDFRLVQLVKYEGGPVDEPDMRYAEMVTPSGLAQIAEYANGVGANIRLILNIDGSPTAMIGDARAAGLSVHAWTLRPENAFLPLMFRGEGGDAGIGNQAALLRALRHAGVSGVFADDPRGAIIARDAR